MTRASGARRVNEVRWLLISISAGLLGIVSGVVWAQLADPARWEVRETGIVLTEDASRGQFSVIVVFTLIGVIAALLWAAAMTLLARHGGWLLVASVAVGSTLAGVVAWQVGMLLGPPPPESVTGLALGDRVPDELRVDGIAPFLVWPIAALVGVLLGTWGQTGLDEDQDETEAATAPVVDTRS
ncbi:hypothetical protein [Aeromicrobium sp. CF3.5]|uniref:hypothetical protein n=1 Tax=Aeromicrobium sp. CF3.5 TaxID=3373078 RepID=UPI003EE63486